MLYVDRRYKPRLCSIQDWIFRSFINVVSELLAKFHVAWLICIYNASSFLPKFLLISTLYSCRRNKLCSLVVDKCSVESAKPETMDKTNNISYLHMPRRACQKMNAMKDLLKGRKLRLGRGEGARRSKSFPNLYLRGFVPHCYVCFAIWH